MMDDMIPMVEKAIETSSHWPDNGWPVAFGNRQVEVSSLKAAESLPKNAVYREEAINYWRQARLTGNDTAESGKKALEALKKGNLADVHDALYLCQYLELPFEAAAKTWRPVYEAFMAKCA
ncbi:hypothetical protein FGF66_02210 [Chlorobaculum thiosulfatiphilum]|uniref:Uncharacterized protein n=2 Tax=Chlorobaculum thiosulfatiphilum TaxID=115852 RepID=A0A5C4SBK8_CHLTI|nr:hypothetical protein [Chlorobaculum thiosulfatiphilum]TNJ40121.1 hypothetical protein FGF66_02210 [Chlorobaculum thiosulfatiphilum]